MFSRLFARNAACKLLNRPGGADAFGPVLLGMGRPVHILQRGSPMQDVIDLATTASVDWQARNGQV